MLASLLFAIASLLPPLDYGMARIELPQGPTLLAVWVSDSGPPVVTIEQPGPSAKQPDPTHFSAVYVAVGGAVITVYVDCGKMDATACLQTFRTRYEQLTSWLKIDAEATAKWRERQPQK